MMNLYKTNILLNDNTQWLSFNNIYNTHVYHSGKLLNITTNLFDKSIFANGPINILITDINNNIDILYTGCRLIETHHNENGTITFSINMENHLLSNSKTYDNKPIIDTFKLKYKMNEISK